VESGTKPSHRTRSTVIGIIAVAVLVVIGIIAVALL